VWIVAIVSSRRRATQQFRTTTKQVARRRQRAETVVTYRPGKSEKPRQGEPEGVGASEALFMRDLACGPPLTPEAPVAAAARGPIRFSLDAVPERERPAIYREFIGRWVCGLDIEPLRDGPFDADMRVWKLPGLQVMSGKIYGSCNQRTPELLADSVHDFTLMVNLGGPYLVARRDDEIVLDDGEATLLSLAQRFSLTHRPPGDMIAVRIPRSRLAPLVAHADDCCARRIPRGNPALKLLLDYVPIATKAQTAAGTELQHVVAGHIHDLVAVAVGATRDAAQAARDGGVRAAQLHAIKQDIAGNLARADLSVAALAARHRCTPRFIQRLFETEGTTFTEYVLAQRLAHAHRMLADPRRAGEKIMAVAYDCGFGDLSYFNRVFRRRYGAAPSDVRAQARQNMPEATALG
jgi:AraC-like DNA-binding protein